MSSVGRATRRVGGGCIRRGYRRAVGRSTSVQETPTPSPLTSASRKENRLALRRPAAGCSTPVSPVRAPTGAGTGAPGDDLAHVGDQLAQVAGLQGGDVLAVAGEHLPAGFEVLGLQLQPGAALAPARNDLGHPIHDGLAEPAPATG